MSEQHYLESLRITGKIQRETNSPELMLIPTQQRLQCVCPVKMISKSPFPHSPMYSCYKKKVSTLSSTYARDLPYLH